MSQAPSMPLAAPAAADTGAAPHFTQALLVVNGVLIAGIYVLAKVAGDAGVSPLGVLSWQLLFAAIVIGGITALRRELPALSRANVRYAAVAGVLGITGPNLASFTALSHVPAGLIGVLTALSPGLTYAIALLFRAEKMQPLRIAGIALGFVGVMAIVLPRGALPGPQALPWVLVALLAPLCLAGGNVFRSLAWPAGLKPMAAASLLLAIQAAVMVPLSVALDAFTVPRGLASAQDLGLAGAGVLTAAFYLGAFELQKRGGAVIVGQLGYVITVASLVLGMLVFGERYPLTTFLAVPVVIAGVMLVNRRPRDA